MRTRNDGYVEAVNLDLVAHVHAEYGLEDEAVAVPSEVYLVLRMRGDQHVTRYVPIDGSGREYLKEDDAENAVRNFVLAANRYQGR